MYRSEDAELMDVGYAILIWFSDLKHSVKKLLNSLELSLNNMRMSLHAFMTLVHSMLPVDEAQKMGVKNTH